MKTIIISVLICCGIFVGMFGIPAFVDGLKYLIKIGLWIY